MGWLVRSGEVLATAEIAEARRDRRKGLLGRAEMEGALILRPCRHVHTMGMRFTIDAAFCDAEGLVLATRCLVPWRFSPFVAHTRMVIEAQAGAFERWGLRPGDVVEIRR